MPDAPALADLETKTLAELHEIAAELDVKRFRALRREELIDGIIAAAAERGGRDAPPAGDRSRPRRLEIEEVDELDEADDHRSAEAPAWEPRLRAEAGDPEEEEEPEEEEPEHAEEDGEVEPEQRSGVLDLVPDGFGFLRVEGLGRSRDDVYLPRAVVRSLGLRKGDHVAGPARRSNRGERHPSIGRVELVNGSPVEESPEERPWFDSLTPIQPTDRLRLQADQEDVAVRMVDLLAPIGKGQRCLVVAPPGSGATTLLRALARVIVRDSSAAPMMVLVDARPEEVTDWTRGVDVPVHASAADRSSDAHVQLADLALERAKRLVEQGHDVVVVLDSISRLARAHSLARPRSRRDADESEALSAEAMGVQAAKRWFSTARNTEEGGSLTILAAVRVVPEGPVDALYGALLDIANMELRLDSELAQSGYHPALDTRRSYNRREAELLGEDQARSLQHLRRSLIPLSAAEAWTETVERLRSTPSNDQLLGSI